MLHPDKWEGNKNPDLDFLKAKETCLHFVPQWNEKGNCKN